MITYKNYSAESCSEGYSLIVDGDIQEIGVRKIRRLCCLENRLVFSRIVMQGMLQWLFYMLDIIHTLSSNGRCRYCQDVQRCNIYHITIWT